MTKKIGSYHVFMFIFMLYFIPKYLEYTTFIKSENIQTWIDVIKNISYILAFLYLIIRILKKNKFYASFFCILISALIYFSYQGFFLDRKSVFVVLIFSAIFEEQYFNNFITALYRISVLLYLLTIFSCKLGIIENVSTTRIKFGMEWIAGGNGFNYSGQMIMMLIPIVFMYYYRKRGKIKFLDNIVWIVINVAVFLQCLTIMGFLLNLVFILLFNVLQYKIKKQKVLLLDRKRVKNLPYIFTLITLILLWIYKNIPQIGVPLDNLFNGRLNLGNIMIKNYGVELFGTRFRNNTLYGYYEILDSEYLQMLVGEGVLYLIIALILSSFMLEYGREKKDYYLVLIWVMILFNAVFNNGIFNLVMNPFGIILTISIKECMNKCRGQTP